MISCASRSCVRGLLRAAEFFPHLSLSLAFMLINFLDTRHIEGSFSYVLLPEAHTYIITGLLNQANAYLDWHSVSNSSPQYFKNQQICLLFWVQRGSSEEWGREGRVIRPMGYCSECFPVNRITWCPSLAGISTQRADIQIILNSNVFIILPCLPPQVDPKWKIAI